MSYSYSALVITLPPVVIMALLTVWTEWTPPRNRKPFTDPLLRPPGESCREKMDELWEKVILLSIGLVLPVIIGVAACYGSAGTELILVLLICSIVWSLYIVGRLILLVRRLQNYRLGFDGERMVGQQLNPGWRKDWKIFHDIVPEGTGRNENIDHVIIAPSGVYAIETKARRKSLGANKHIVTYDGEKLIFPEGRDVKALKQADRNAQSLAQMLKGAVGEPIAVEAILTLPGWWIETSGKGKVHVVNSKQIVDWIDYRPRRLSDKLIKQIDYQLRRVNGEGEN